MSCQKIVETKASIILEGKFHWREAFLGDSTLLVFYSLCGVWHYLILAFLFIIWKIRCNYVLENETTLEPEFRNPWKEEVHMQLVAKGSQLIKNAKSFDPIPYSEFIVILLSLRNSCVHSFSLYHNFIMSYFFSIIHNFFIYITNIY